jgi:hypothetical protein
MSSSGPSEENSLAGIINPYMRKLKMHPKELLLKDGELQIKDVQDPKLKEEQEAGGSRARNSTFVGSMNAIHVFSHNMQGPTFPVLDLNFMPIIKEGMLVTDELCAQYRVLEREIQILQEENLRLRRMLEYFINPRMIPPPSKE